MLAVVVLTLASCVQTPGTEVSERWVSLAPGNEISVVFGGGDGGLAGVALFVAAGAVSSPVDLRLDVPLRADGAFLQAGDGFEVHTPVVQVAPAGLRFSAAVRLVLPWVGLDDTVAENQVRVLRTDGPDGVPRGLWEAVSTVSVHADRIEITLDRPGVYWAGHWRDDAFAQPVTIFGEPCLEAVSRLDDCAGDEQCMVSGCMAEVCGAAPVETVCRPTDAVIARRDCACRCSASRCQWIR